MRSNGAWIMNGRACATFGTAVLVAMSCVTRLAACMSSEVTTDDKRLEELGAKYTAAWCSQNASGVAAFFAEDGSLTINDGVPSVGRAAITAAAQGFMSAFPDMVVTMDGIAVERERVIYRWTLTGTNTGPGGTGQAVRITISPSPSVRILRFPGRSRASRHRVRAHSAQTMWHRRRQQWFSHRSRYLIQSRFRGRPTRSKRRLLRLLL